jgi:RNA polymerase sigma factor (sigma-70 family)
MGLKRSRQLGFPASGSRPRGRAVPGAEITDAGLLSSDAPEAFASFYRRHVRGLLGHLVRLTGDPDLAADLMAETFASALSSRTAFDPARGSAKGWLYGIAHNKLADYRRRGFAELRALDRLGMERVDLTVEDRQEIEYLGGVSAVELVEELPGDQRAVVAARVIHERSYEDIAREHAVSEQAVRKRVSRALTLLRRHLGLVDETR